MAWREDRRVSNGAPKSYFANAALTQPVADGVAAGLKIFA
jgi:hypothetical protein